MGYIRLSPETVWDELGDGKTVVGVVLDDTGNYDIGVYDLTDLNVNAVIELINEDNTVFFMKQED